VGHSGRDEQHVAGLERHRWVVGELIFERAFEHVNDLFAGVTMSRKRRSRGEVDARLEGLSSRDSEVMALKIDACASGWPRRIGRQRHGASEN
jgi:hypothetical protein